MTKHRTISGFVAVALLAAATTALTIKYSSSAGRPAASTEAMSIAELTAGAGKLPIDEFDDRSVIYAKKR